MKWHLKHPAATPDMLGYVPQFLDPADPRPAAQQIADNYAFGGGWNPTPGFTILPNGNLKFPGDPQFQLIAEVRLRNEIIRFYQHAWLAIVQPDGSYEVARVD